MHLPIPVLHPITRLIVGGAQENTLFTAERLDRQLYSVTVICGPQTGSEGSLIAEGMERGIDIKIIPELVREINPLKDLIALWKLYREMRSNHYMIVHTHSSKAGIIGRIAAKLSQTPVIIHTIHGWSFHEHMPSFVRGFYILLEKICALYSDLLIVVAETDRQKGLEAHIGSSNQYLLIRSAIPLDDFDPHQQNRQKNRLKLGIPENVPVLGNIGRLSLQKNPLEWVKIAGEIGRALPDAWFLIVGDGPLRDEVRTAVEVEQIATRTLMTGLRRDIPDMLSIMDVFLMTSLWEGLPRVIPQAMAMKVPIVAYANDGIVEVIQHEKTGILIPSGDRSQASRRCIALLSDTKENSLITGEAYRFVHSEFKLDKMIEQISLAYNQLLIAKKICPSGTNASEDHQR